MTYEELKKAYEESMQKCSELEKEIEDKDLRIEHLTELLIKRNKMLFGQKSEKGKYICDGQLSLEGIVLNEAEEQSDFNVSEPTADTVIKKSKETGKHRGRKEIRADLETKKIVYELPNDEQIYLSPNASGGLTPLSPPSELQEIPVAIREQSGVLCFHSR